MTWVNIAFENAADQGTAESILERFATGEISVAQDSKLGYVGANVNDVDGLKTFVAGTNDQIDPHMTTFTVSTGPV